MVRKAVGLVRGLNQISRGDVILIKPNVVVPINHSEGATTNPLICKTIADLVREAKATPIIAESSAVGVDTEKSFQVAGYERLRDEGFKVVDLKKVEKVKVPVPRGKVLKEITLPEIVVEANKIISVPKMKTHDQAPVSLSLKNIKGVIPDSFKRKFHTTLGVFQAVADLCTVVRPKLSVVDGIIGQEGLGPIYGTPVEMDIIIAGKDPVAVDTVTSMVMGFNPKENELIRHAAEQDVGTMDLNRIEVVGEKVSKVMRRFKSMSEAVNEKITLPEDFEIVFAENACTGCRNTILSVLADLKADGTLDSVRGLRVVAGKTEEIPKDNNVKMLIVGNCAAKVREQGRYVSGCPPNNRDVISEIVREEKPARYWEP